MPLFIENDKQLLYIHIPKCAGSSIEATLKNQATIFQLHSPKFSDLPSTPQHFQAELNSIVFKNAESINNFTVVRHPLARIISEYFWRNRHRVKDGREPIEINKHIKIMLEDYSYDNYSYDNHIRPQIEFPFRTTQIFRLEEGIDSAIFWGLNKLEFTEYTESLRTDRNKSKKMEFDLSRKTVDLVEKFYRYDYEFLGYGLFPKDKDNFTYAEINEIISLQAYGGFAWNEELYQDYWTTVKKEKFRLAEILKDEAIKLKGISPLAACLLTEKAMKLKPEGKKIKGIHNKNKPIVRGLLNEEV